MNIFDDLFNTELITSAEEVDNINKRFYGRYNYPWPARNFPSYPRSLALKFLNQDIGNWTHSRIPKHPRIWVAGCGTNQSIYTALRYPEAKVLGTDISTESLNQARKIASEIGITNLQLEEENMNKADYKEEFDFIICTGVVHHNSSPETTLKNISKALKQNGIMEFMVYNYYHRVLTTACQKAVRAFYESKNAMNMEFELSLIKQLMSGLNKDSMMGNFINSFKDDPEAKLVDSLLQPVEYSYTIEGMEKMLDICNLQSLLHCINQFDAVNNAVNWNLSFNDKYLENHYNSLADKKRWQITNLLMLGKSPMLWFYLQRKDSSLIRKSEKEVCAEFMENFFMKNTFSIENYQINSQGNYEHTNVASHHPIPTQPLEPLARKVWDAVSPNVKMKDIFRKLEIQPSFAQINNMRIRLTTLQFPYLIAIS